MSRFADPTLREKDGRYHALFYDRRKEQYKWISLGTGSEKLARRRMVRLEDRFFAGTFDPAKDRAESQHLGDAIEEWTESQDQIRENTRRIRRAVLRDFRSFIGADKDPVAVDRISPRECRDWIHQEHLSDHSRRNYYKYLNIFFKWAVEAGYRTDNPIEPLDTPKVSGSKTPQFLTREEVTAIQEAIHADYENRIRKHCRGCVIWMVDLIEVAVRTGLRRSELCYQRWIDTDLERGFFRVRPYEDEHRSFTTKNDKERMVPLDETTRMILRRLRETQRDKGHYELRGTVFTGRSGSALGPEQLTRHFGKYRREALPEREEISFHNLRHTAASWMVQNGMDLYYVKEILGHRSIETTQKYAHLAKDSVRGALTDALGGL